jgi:ABC-type lipoprotein release transport system permease subunit
MNAAVSYSQTKHAIGHLSPGFAFLAGLIPARRAASIEPVKALRIQ